MAGYSGIIEKWGTPKDGDTSENKQGYGGVIGGWENEEHDLINGEVDAVVYKAVAASSTPDGEAEIAQLARDSKVPADVVRRNTDATKGSIERQQINAATQDTPNTRAFLQDPAALAATRDDGEGLAAIERDFFNTPVGRAVYGEAPDIRARRHELGVDFVELELSAAMASDLGKAMAIFAKDAPISAVKGSIGLAQAVVGISDIVTGSHSGKIFEATGMDMQVAQEFYNAMYSERYKGIQEEVMSAEGWLDTIEAVLSKPEIIGHTVIESLPSLYGGSIIARGLLMLTNLLRTARAATALTPGVELATRTLAPRIAAALGEGAITTGSMTEGARAEAESGLVTAKQSTMFAAAGIGTAIFGFLGNTIAGKFGIDDIDVLLTTKKSASTTVRKNVGRRVIEGMASEGILEELPQSLQEQLWENLATDKPLFEGIEQAGVLGMLAGMAMGGGTNLATSGMDLAVRKRQEKRKAQNAQLFAEQQQLLSEKVDGTKTAERNPVLMEKFLNDNMGLKDQDAYIEGSKILELDQTSPKVLDELVSQLGGDKQSIIDAAVQGRDVRVNLGVFHARLTPETKTALFESIKASPGAYSVAQVAEGLAQAEEVFEEQYGGFAAENEAVQTEMTRLEQEMVAAGAAPDVASQTAQVAARMSLSLAEKREGTTAAEMMQKLSVTKDQVARGGARELSQVVDMELGRIKKFAKEFRDKVGTRAAEAQREAEAYEGWKFEVGDRVVGSIPGKVYKVVGRTSIKGDPRYTVETLDGKERTQLSVELGAHESVRKLTGPTELAQSEVSIDPNSDNPARETRLATQAAQVRLERTLAVLNNSVLKGREGKMVKVQTIQQVLKQKGVKTIEKAIVNYVLEQDAFKGQKSVPYDDFVLAVELELLPLEQLNVSTWQDYGASAIGFNADDMDSVVYNSTIHNTSWSEHFRTLFSKGALTNRKTYEVQQVPSKPDVYVALDVDRPAGISAEDLQQYVGTAGSRESVEAWIQEQKDRTATPENAGLFGHVRRWDVGEDRYLAEIQSDFYQKPKVYRSPEELVADMFFADPQTQAEKDLVEKIGAEHSEAVRVIEHADNKVKAAFEDGNAKFALLTKLKKEQQVSQAKESSDEAESSIDGPGDALGVSIARVQGELDNLTERWGITVPEYEQFYKANQAYRSTTRAMIKSATLTPAQMQLIAHRKNYTERMFREEIRQAAIAGKKRLLIPHMSTLAFIESYPGAEGQHRARSTQYYSEHYEILYADDKASLVAADQISVEGEVYIVLENGEGFDSFTAVPEDKIENHFDLEQFVEEKIESWLKDTWDSLPDAPKYSEIDEGEWYGEVSGEVLKEWADEWIEENVNEDELPKGEDGDSVYDDIEIPVAKDLDDKVDEYVREMAGSKTSAIDLLHDMYSDHKVVITAQEHVYIVEEDAVQNFPQPEAKEEDTEADTEEAKKYLAQPQEFDISQIADVGRQNVLQQYPKHAEFLKSIKPEGFNEDFRDRKGYAWYSVDITEQDAVDPVVLFQTQPTRTGALQIFDDAYIIKLMEGSNPSTPFHELAHVHLHEMQTAVDQGAASAEMVDDNNKTQEWLSALDKPEALEVDYNKYRPQGYEERGFDTLDARETEEVRAILKQEMFARGFEAYLMEGKAPEADLIPAFKRFARWLRQVYKHVKSLGVQLSPEIREVYDSMLQTSQKVDATIDAIGLQPLTKSQLDELGVLPEDRAYLDKLYSGAQEEATRKMLGAILSGIKANRDDWKEQGERQADQNPMHQTVQKLTKGVGIDRAAAVHIWGKAVIDRMPAGLKQVFKVGGMIPDEVAFEEGFNTAEALFDALEVYAARDQEVKNYVAQKKVEFKNSFDPADFIFDTDEFAEYLAVVGKYTADKAMGPDAQLDEKLSKGEALAKTGKQDQRRKPALARSAFRTYARKLVRDMPLRDAARPDIFMWAVKKAAQAEAAAIKKGGWAAAQQANENMRLNFEMAKESRHIEREVQKVERLAKRIKKMNPAKVKAEYLGAALRLAARFQLITLNPAHAAIIDKAGDINALLMAGQDENMGVTAFGFDAFLTDSTSDFNYKDMTPVGLEELRTLMNAMVKQGREAITPTLTSLGITMAEAQADLTQAASQLKDKKVWAKRGRSFFGIDPKAALRKLSDRMRRAYADTNQLWAMIRILDGFTYYTDSEAGPFERYMRDNLEKAYARKATDTRYYTPKLKKAFKQLFNRAKNPRAMPTWLDEMISVPVPAPLRKDGRGWDFEAVVSVAMNIGNESNLQRLKDGYGWTDEQIENIVSVLNDSEWDAIQMLGDIFEEMRPEFFAASERINGIAPPRIEPRAFTTPTGKVMGGWYAPAVYDHANVRAAELDEKQLLKETANSAHQRASVNSRATHTRAQSSGGLPIRLDLSGIVRQFEYNLQFTAFAETVRDTAKILNNQAVADMIEQKVGREWLPAMREVLTKVANPGADRNIKFGTYLLKSMGTAASRYILGGNRGVGIKQVFSIPAVYVEGGSWHRGFKYILSNPVKAWNDMLEDAPNIERRIKSVQIDREVASQREKLLAQSNLKGVPKEIIDAVLFAYIRFFDTIAVFPAYYGTKELMERKYGPGKRAQMETEKILFDTQPITREMDLSALQLDRTSLSRLLTFFSGFTMKFENRKRVYVRGFLEGKIPLKDFMFHVLLERLAPPILMNLLFTMGAGEEPELDDILWDTLLYQLCGFPVIRELSVAAVNAARRSYDSDFKSFSVFNTPLLTPVQAMERNMNTLATWFTGDVEGTEAAVAAADVFLSAAGVPAVKIVKDMQESARQFEYSNGFDKWFKLLFKPDPEERE